MAYLDWLKRISKLVLKTTEDYGDVPGGAIPAINLLIDVAKWDQKRAVKPKIIKNLCQKHSIDPEAVNSFDDLIAKGITENEIETAYARAMAKIDNPLMVRYLETVKSDLALEITEYFAQLSLLFKGPYILLQPVERVLENPPTRKIFAEPVFFRKTGPVYADFVGGKVVIRTEVDKTIKQLNQKKALLMVGAAATGKTVIVRNICHKWIKKGWVARIVELKKEPAELERLVEETTRFGQEESNALIVLEDAHLNPQLINRYLDRRLSTWPILLITSRTAAFGIHTESTNHLEDLSKIELETHDPADDIIDLYLGDKKNKGWEIDSSLKHEIKAVAQKNLWVLSYALKSLGETEARAIDKKNILKKVKKDLQNLGYVPSSLQETTKQLFIPILVSLSNLFRGEIQTDVRFLHHWLTHTNKLEINTALRALESMGEIVKTETDQTELYGLPHSSLAHLYFNYAKGSKYADFADDHKLVLGYLFSENAANRLEPCFPRFDSERNYQTFINAYTPSIIGKIDKVKLAETIAQNQDIYEVTRAIEGFFWVTNSEDGKELWSLIDKKKLADNITQCQDLSDVNSAIGSICEASSDFGKEIVSLINKKILANNIGQIQALSGAGWIIKHIYAASPEDGKELVSLIDKKSLADNIALRQNLSNVAIIIDSIYITCPEDGKKLVSLIDKKKLAENIAQSQDLSGIDEIIYAFYKTSFEDSKKLASLIDKKILADNIAQMENVYISWLTIGFIHKFNSEAAKEIVSLIDKKRMAKNIAQNEVIYLTGAIIKAIHNVSSEAGKKLVSLIDMKRMAENIAQNEFISEASDIIKAICEVSSEAGKELWSLIDKKRLAKNIYQNLNLFEGEATIKALFEVFPEAGRELQHRIDKLKSADQ